MKVVWAIVWAVTWVAWAAAAPTKMSDGATVAASPHSLRVPLLRPATRVQRDTSKVSAASSKAVQQPKFVYIPSLSSSVNHKRHILDSHSLGTRSLASLFSMPLGLPSAASPFANPVLGVAQAGVPFDISPTNPDKRSVQASSALGASLPSSGPSLASPAFFVKELEALEDLIQSGSLSSLSITEPGSYQGDVGGATGQQGVSGGFQGNVRIPLQVTQTGSDVISDPQFLSGDILNTNSGNLRGWQGAFLVGGGGLQDYGSINLPPIDFGAGDLEARQLDHGAFVATDLLGTTGGLQGASGSFDGSFLSSGGLDGLQLSSGGFDTLSSDSFGASLPLGNTGGLPGGSGGLDGLQSSSFVDSLPLENTGGLQSGSGGFEGLQGGSFGVPLPAVDYGDPVGEVGGLDGLQGGSFGLTLPAGGAGDLQLESLSLGNLQGNLGNFQVDTAGLAATQLSSGGFDGVTLQAAGFGEAGVGFSSTAGTEVNTGVLLGASGVSGAPSGDLGNVGVSLTEAVQANQFSNQPTVVPGTFTASSFDAASLDSLGEILSGNVEDITNPSQSLGSFLMDLNGKNGMMVLHASNLDALQSGQLSIAAAANASLHTVFDGDAELRNDGLFDSDLDLTTQNEGGLVAFPSLATLLASTIGTDNIAAGTEGALFVSLADNASTTTTTSTSTTTTTTTPGPPRLGTILPNILFSKGQFFGTLFGGLLQIGRTAYKIITETDWTAPPPYNSGWA